MHDDMHQGGLRFIAILYSYCQLSFLNKISFKEDFNSILVKLKLYSHFQNRQKKLLK